MQVQHETDTAYQAYCCYRDLGPMRTLEAAWIQYAHERGLPSRRPSAAFRGWYGRFDWRTRAELHDAQNEDVPAETRRQKIIDLAHRIATGEVEASPTQANMVRDLLKYLPRDSVVSDTKGDTAETEAALLGRIQTMTPAELVEVIRGLR